MVFSYIDYAFLQLIFYLLFGIMRLVINYIRFSGIPGNTPQRVHFLADMAELADAPDLGSGGRPCRFKSCYPHKIRVSEDFS